MTAVTVDRNPDRRVPDVETWDAPHRLNPDDCRVEIGGREREPPRFDEEDDQ